MVTKIVCLEFADFFDEKNLQQGDVSTIPDAINREANFHM